MGSVCVHKKDLAGDNPHISVESRIPSRHLKHSGISEMCSAIPRLLEQSETSRTFQNHPEKIRVDSSISEASRHSEQFRNAPRISPTIQIFPRLCRYLIDNSTCKEIANQSSETADQSYSRLV